MSLIVTLSGCMYVYNSISAYIRARKGCQVSFSVPPSSISVRWNPLSLSLNVEPTYFPPPVSWQSEIPRDPPVSTSPPTLSVEVTEACNDAHPLLSAVGIELMSSCLLSNGDMKSCPKNKDVHL